MKMQLRAVALVAVALACRTPAPAAAQAAPDDNPTGLPGGVEWKFNFDATWGTFGFANSLYQNPKEGVPENLSDQWFEGSIKPALSGVHKLASSSEIYGKVSAVGERTYGEQPSVFGGDFSSFQVDDLSIGWRSGKSVGTSENLLDFTVGRTTYTLGHGMLLWDGSAEGGSRGGYWTNARKAFAFAAIGRLHPGNQKVETFYLVRDDLQENETGTKLAGVNYEYALGEHSTFGATYMKFYADPAVKPGRDGLNVFNLRAYTAPIPSTPDLSFEFEYASERNGDLLHSNAWTGQGSYELSKTSWKPKFTYRYAYFQGDDPSTTTRNENFDPLLPGFSDWGSWWQGEIIGEYIASNSNLVSNMLRAHVSPTEKVGGGLMYYNFTLDQPGALAKGVTSKELAKEFDAYVDWKLNGHFTASFVGAFASPGTAAQQAFNRTQNFSYGMVFIAYSY
jgi:Alginate export